MSAPLTQMLPKITVSHGSNVEGTFTIEPLEPGFGHTIGNALRRTILSSTEGYAITHMKLLSRPLHEFDAIEGVSEDVTAMILNLKQVRLKKKGEVVLGEEDKLSVSISGKKTFTAGDLIPEGSTAFEVSNPDHIICHLDESTQLDFEFTIQSGKGYVPAEEHKKEEDREIGSVAIDAIYTPVKNVKVQVENTLVGKRTDYERLIIEVKTDGTLAPEEAFRRAATLLKTYFFIFSGDDFLPKLPAEQPVDQVALKRQRLLETPLSDLLSVRSVNSLEAKNIYTLGDVVKLSIPELMKLKGFGKQSLKELEQVLNEKGLGLGMKYFPS